MQVSDVARLYEYSCWANQRLLGVVRELSPDEFTRPVAGAYGSVRNTLVHVLSAEWGWLDRCGGLPRGKRLEAEDYPTIESVVAVWDVVAEAMRAFLAELRDEDLAQKISFALGTGPAQSIARGDLLQHAILHGVHHRGQVALLLRALGHTPGNFDLVLYDGEAQDARGKSSYQSVAREGAGKLSADER